MPLPPNQIGAIPQGQAMQMGKGGQLDPQAIEALRADPEVKQAMEMFVGHPIDMKIVPPELIKEVAGMVHKLGVQGAVQMAQKMLPPDVQAQLKQGAGGPGGPSGAPQSPAPQMPPQGAPPAR